MLEDNVIVSVEIRTYGNYYALGDGKPREYSQNELDEMKKEEASLRAFREGKVSEELRKGYIRRHLLTSLYTEML